MAAVRAIAPVAGIPPKSEDIILPTPCPTSSAFERWCPPIIPSETTHDKSDSIEASIAIVNAGRIISLTRPKLNSGTEKVGKPALISYKSPIVATLSLKHCTIIVVTIIAMSEPGIF